MWRAQIGGAIEVSGGRLLLQTTLLKDNVAPVGANLHLAPLSTASYVLPALPGYWVPANKCEIWREALASQECSMNYTNNVDPCQEAAGSEKYTGAACPMARESQPCDWRNDPTLLGEVVYVLPLGSQDSTVPTPCSVGLLGGNGSDATEQTSAMCAGLCPAGNFCAEEATVHPALCTAGGYCPKGSPAVTLCDEGSYGNGTGLVGQSGCTPCPTGHGCRRGGLQPVPCRPGTVAPDASTGECAKCAAGTFQDGEGHTACKPCEPGAYCPEGASVPLPCIEGSYSSATDLSSAAQCTSTEPGFYAATGSTTQTPCNPGAMAADGRMGVCLLCEPGEFQPDGQATSCLPCADANMGVFCPHAGTSTPTPCDGGTYSSLAGLSSKLQCTPVVAGFYAPTGSRGAEACPTSGFICPGRAADQVNDPPGSKPILVDSGLSSVDVEV